MKTILFTIVILYLSISVAWGREGSFTYKNIVFEEDKIQALESRIEKLEAKVDYLFDRELDDLVNLSHYQEIEKLKVRIEKLEKEKEYESKTGFTANDGTFIPCEPQPLSK